MFLTDCGKRDTILNSIEDIQSGVRLDKYTYIAKVVKYTCKQGYELYPNDADTTYVCDEGDSWKHQDFSCIKSFLFTAWYLSDMYDCLCN